MALRPLLVALVLTAFALVSAAPAAAEPGVPPEVLAPAAGATTQAGQPVTFRVRSHAGDGYLWVLFSNSPAPVNPCGKIGQEHGLRRLEPTADPTIYEATAPMYDTYTHWLNRPGTYFWQAYRIEYGGGADGCTEAAPRALTVVGRRPIEIGPTPTAPADKAVLLSGPQAAFTATGLPSDEHLWLHVSKSPATTERGNLLDDDADIEKMLPSGTAGTFSARIPYYRFPTFWMNAPGTYYWQVFRISSFGDPDGYVEGPVRSVVIRRAPSMFGSGGVVIAPSTKKCVSRRLFTIRIRRISGVTYRKVTVKLRGKTVRTLSGSRIYAKINLRGLPKGTWTVEIRATTTTGRVLKGTRRYRTCTKKLPSSNTSPL